MFNFLIDGELLYPRAVILGILFFAACGLLGWSWSAFHRSQRFHRIILGGAGIFVALLFAAMVFSAAPDHDEVEHANAAWQMSQGLLPYNDFFQHHSPMLWIILSPFFKIPHIANHPLESIRLLSTGISLFVLLMLSFMARSVWKDRKAAWVAILFFAGNFLTLQLYNLRPDLLANLFNLSAFFLIMQRRKMIAYGLAGLLLGFSLSFSPKYGPYLLLMPVLIAVYYKNLSFYLRALPVHAAGIAIGLLPLFIWLSAHDLMTPFYQWVIAFNASRISDGASVFGGKFQLLPTGFGVWGCILLLKSQKEESRYHGRLLCILMGLSALVYLKPSRLHHAFYEQMYILTGILAASGPFLFLLKKWSMARRAVAAFLLSGFVLWGSVYAAQKGLRHGSFARGKELMQTLKRAAGNEEVVCILPDHPVTSRNAVYLCSGWEYYSWLSYPAVREKLRNLFRDLQTADPAVIFNRNNQPYFRLRPDILTHLQNTGILSADETDVLRKTINARYRLVEIQEREFWVRNDRYAACF